MFPTCLLLLFLLVVPSLQALQVNNVHEHARRSIASPHVTTRNGQFMKDGKPFRYIGTNAYWLHQLNTDKDLEDTMNAISSYGIKVVRTWAFNDVTEIPKSGIYFQLWKNGTAVINTGANGLLRLDKVVKAAEKAGLHLLFSLTNNWAPNGNSTTPAAGGNGTSADSQPGYLSNTYGGMDTYVQQILGHEATHDEFYTNPKIVSAFKEYLNVIVPRYANSSAVLGWELANDPRCNSTIPAGTLCNPHTITNWTTDIGSHVKTLDPNHLVASGDAGFYCVDCVKLHPLNPTPAVVPRPRPSNTPRKRTPGPLTKAKVLRKVQSIADKLRSKRKGTSPAKRGLSQMSSNGGTVIRGVWVPTRKPRQVQNVGPAFDGTYGVDTEDILNSPSVDFSSFQYFPDQNVYNQDQTNTGTDNFDSTVQQGVEWIQQHADTSATYGKPASITGFGIVSQPNSNSFTPVDETQTTPLTHTAADEAQQVEAYTTWIDEAINQQITGITHYQWGQTGLTTAPDGVIQTNSGDTLPSSNGFSPNDGYATYSTAVKDALQVGATKLQNVASDDTSGAT